MQIDQIPEILQKALRNGGEMAEIFIEETASTSISCEDRKIERAISGVDRGAGIRVITGDKTAYIHTNELDYSSLLLAAERVSEKINHPAKSYRFDYSVPDVAVAGAKVAETPLERKAEVVLSADNAAWDIDRRVQQVSVQYGDSLQKVTIANSSGLCVSDIRCQTVFRVRTVASEAGRIQTGYEVVGASVGFELFDEHDSAEVARKATMGALLMLGARSAPTGTMPVVISSEAGGTMIHEAVGHGLEADLVQKGMSRFSGRLGTRIASALVTVVDDATILRKRGSFAVDDEGAKACRTTLIEGGVLKQFMYDFLTAAKEGVASTGNGRRESYRHKPIPRMTNTMILPGDMDPSDILQATERGLFVKKMGGGEVNTVNGDFQFEVSEGYLIEKGAVGEPVRGVSLIGNGPEILQEIDMVGNDLGFAVGTCGKEGQGVPVTDAQPTLRIKSLTVGGTDA